MIAVNIIVQAFIQTPRGYNPPPPSSFYATAMETMHDAKVEFLWWTIYTLHDYT